MTHMIQTTAAPYATSINLARRAIDGNGRDGVNYDALAEAAKKLRKEVRNTNEIALVDALRVVATHLFKSAKHIPAAVNAARTAALKAFGDAPEYSTAMTWKDCVKALPPEQQVREALRTGIRESEKNASAYDSHLAYQTRNVWREGVRQLSEIQRDRALARALDSPCPGIAHFAREILHGSGKSFDQAPILPTKAEAGMFARRYRLD